MLQNRTLECVGRGDHRILRQGILDSTAKESRRTIMHQDENHRFRDPCSPGALARRPGGKARL